MGATSHVEDILMLVAHTRPHVIVLEEDIAIDTLAGLTRLIADRHPDVRTIILTNDRREHVRRRLYGVLVSAILEKPFTLDDLIGIIRGSTLHSLRFAWCL